MFNKSCAKKCLSILGLERRTLADQLGHPTWSLYSLAQARGGGVDMVPKFAGPWCLGRGRRRRGRSSAPAAWSACAAPAHEGMTEKTRGLSASAPACKGLSLSTREVELLAEQVMRTRLVHESKSDGSQTLCKGSLYRAKCDAFGNKVAPNCGSEICAALYKYQALYAERAAPQVPWYDFAIHPSWRVGPR